MATKRRFCDIKQHDISKFLVKRNERDELSETAETTAVSSEQVPSTNSTDQQPVLANTNDVSKFVLMQMSSVERVAALENIWIPDPSFPFPSSGTRKLKFQHSWLRRFNWLAYSQQEDGAYCKFCILFAPQAGVGTNNQRSGRLVVEKYNRWKDALEDFAKHQATDYHKHCVIDANNLLQMARNEMQPIDVVLDSRLKQEIDDNRKGIIPVVETVILCGRQGLALRGDNDQGSIESLDLPVNNDGNFRALLRFRAQGGDQHLASHLLNCAHNAMYISPVIQNEIILACNELMLNELVCKVNAACCFSVLADETADVSGTEQLSLGVRYMDCASSTVNEDFLQFVPVYDVTGKGLADMVSESLTKWGVDARYLRGQGYDGAAAMSGQFRGAQAYIRAVHPLALYVHCGSHSLNLAVSDACSVAPIRNCFGTITSVYNFLNTPKRQEVLRNAVTSVTPKSQTTRLTQMCPTRWIARHDSVIVFLELLKPVLDSLETISEWRDKDSSATAQQLLNSLKQPEFLISLHVVAKVFAVSLGLCRCLQKSDLDLAEALRLADGVLDVIDDMRSNCQSVFAELFGTVEQLCNDIDVELVKPRLSKRQTNRCNIVADTAEEYFRVAVFVPFIDSFSLQLKDRLLEHRSVLNDFMCLLPSKECLQPNSDQVAAIQRLADNYADDLGCSPDVAVGEQALWYQQLAAMQKHPRNAVEAHALCNAEVFPCIRKLLQVMATLPVTTCSSERSFSTLRRLKTYLRSTMSSQRLNGLALLNIHRHIHVDATAVVDKLAEKPRRLPFRLK